MNVSNKHDYMKMRRKFIYFLLIEIYINNKLKLRTTND